LSPKAPELNRIAAMTPDTNPVAKSTYLLFIDNRKSTHGAKYKRFLAFFSAIIDGNELRLISLNRRNQSGYHNKHVRNPGPRIILVTNSV
jgi:hypothetical protein